MEAYNFSKEGAGDLEHKVIRAEGQGGPGKSRVVDAPTMVSAGPRRGLGVLVLVVFMALPGTVATASGEPSGEPDRGAHGQGVGLPETVPDSATAPPGQSDAKGKSIPLLNNRDMQSVTHLVGSHVAIVTRPVSAAFRLLSLIHDVSLGSVRWIFRSRRISDSLPGPVLGMSMDLEAWEKKLDEITGRPSSTGTLDLLVDGQEYFARLERRIGEARKSVKMRTYIFDNDDVALELADLLREKSRKIDVRILLDGLGTILATSTEARSLPPGHTPPASVREYLTRDSDVRVRQQFNIWLTGDHAKTTIIDSRYAFMGGMNIGREYRYEWHDVMMEVQGPVVGELEREFEKVWSHSSVLGDLEKVAFYLKRKKRPAASTGFPVRVLYTKPGDREIYYAQLEAIRRAKRYIYIETPYLTDDAMVHSLAEARKRGVDVKIILPRDPNWSIMRSNNNLAAKFLLERGVKVYLYPGMSHVKAAVYDGWACLGSANHDNLSFRTNYEVNIATSHPPAVGEILARIFRRDMDLSSELLACPPVRDADYLLEVVADQL